uniref:Uncharacterized protein n=1 Tax=Arundo donax TaxID=35708 RepID=A0A0A8YVK9_ARUDO
MLSIDGVFFYMYMTVGLLWCWKAKLVCLFCFICWNGSMEPCDALPIFLTSHN